MDEKRETPEENGDVGAAKVLLFDRVTRREEETEGLGSELGRFLRERLERAPSEGIFTALYGDLGAGKTAFVRGMAAILSPKAHVTSPTYAIVNEYGGEFSFRHLDLYRIRDEEDLFSVGFFDFLGEGVLAVEWCENLPADLAASLPLPRVKVRFSKLEGQERRIQATFFGAGEAPSPLFPLEP